ncbi:MAG: glycosyltransferase [Tepidisphaeraceae bacterium]
MLDLSIIIPTCNRAVHLERLLVGLWTGVGCEYEVIVVDGASADDTPDVLADAKRSMGAMLRVIREGFVRATNKGLRAARGRNVTWINDDARPLPGSLDAAVVQMDTADDRVGMLAMYHRCDATKNIAYETTHRGQTYKLMHVRGTLYANFGLARRATWERLDYFDDRFFLYGADPDLSLKVWHAGLTIEPARGSFIDHDEHADERRASDSDRGRRDNEALFAKWDLPAKNLERNDFDPARPCTLRGLRQTMNEAA